MDREIMGQVLDGLIPGDSNEIDEATLGMLFPPVKRRTWLTKGREAQLRDSPKTTAADSYSTGSRRSLCF
jgi:hypothetical protein